MRTLSRWDLTTPTPTPLSPHNPTMQMLFESSFSFGTQQVTTRLQSGEAATAGEEGVNRTVARQSSRAAPAGGAAKRAGRISWWSPWRTSPGHTPFPSGFSQREAATAGDYGGVTRTHHYPGALPPGWVGLHAVPISLPPKRGAGLGRGAQRARETR
jgi:hypothetical protein